MPASPIDRKEYLGGLRRDAPGVQETRLVPAPVRVREFLVVQGADATQKLELVTQVCPHHLRAVRGDRELDAVLDERTERVADGVLGRECLGQQVRRRAD